MIYVLACSRRETRVLDRLHTVWRNRETVSPRQHSGRLMDERPRASAPRGNQPPRVDPPAVVGMARHGPGETGVRVVLKGCPMKHAVRSQSVTGRTRPFQGQNTGSNPVGDAIKKPLILSGISPFRAGFPRSDGRRVECQSVPNRAHLPGESCPEQLSRPRHIGRRPTCTEIKSVLLSVAMMTTFLERFLWFRRRRVRARMIAMGLLPSD